MPNFLCVALTQKRLNVGIVNDKGEIVKYHYQYFEDLPSDLDVITDIVRLSKNVSKGYNPVMCTVAIPEIVDAIEGIWNSFRNGFGIPIRSTLQKKLGIPVFVDNDCKVSAVGEKEFGSMQYEENFCYISAADGLGGALYINNKLFRGIHNGAGEFGHISIDDEGELCDCGARGCVETFATSKAITKYYEILSSKKISSFNEVVALARHGDTDAIESFNRAGYALGKMIAYILNITNITRFVIGGVVGMEYDLLEKSIYEAVNKYALKTPNYDFKITKTEIGYDAALIGCAAYSLIVSRNPGIYAQLQKKGV